MKLRISIIFALTLMLISCTSKVNRIKERMQKDFDTELGQSIDPVVATMAFYAYAVPENYWYSESTTAREIIDDEFRQGLLGLEKLDRQIQQISTKDEEINASIQNLHERIKETQKKLKEAKQALRQANSVFGLAMFGGANTLLDFAQLLGGENTEDDEAGQLPKEVKSAFERLVHSIEKHDLRFCANLRAFEIKTTDNNKLSDDEAKTVRKNLKEIVVEQIKQRYSEPDTLSRNRMSKMILSTFDDAFPIGSPMPDFSTENQNEANTASNTHNEDRDRSSIQADYDALSAKIDQLESATTEQNETLAKDRSAIASLQKKLKDILSNSEATSSDLSSAKELISELSDKVKEYEADIASTEMKN